MLSGSHDQISGPVEVRAVGAFHGGRADGLHQLLAVVRELVDGVHVIVDDPHVLFGIVGIDGDEVRALENFVPLRPGLDDFAVAVDDRQAVSPTSRRRPRVALPEFGSIVRILSGAAGAGQGGDGGVAPGQSADGELEARPEVAAAACVAGRLMLGSSPRNSR